MAFLIPENIPSRSGVPDRLRHVARALRDFMPDDTTVWLRDDRSGRPYLELLDPAAGIAVIEAPSIRRAARKRRWFGQPLNEEEVLRIREDVAARTEHLRTRIDRSLVRSLPVKHVLAAPDHTEDPVDGIHPAENLTFLLGSDMTGPRLHTVLRRMLGAGISVPLNAQEENRVRAEINPAVIIDPKVLGSESESGETLPLFQDPEVAPEDILRVMDRQQERLAEHMGWGYRILRGVAGSGKTLVLTHRARYLHRYLPNHHILVLCFNRLLANALEQMVGPTDRITVTNIDRLAYKLARTRATGRNPDFEEQRRRATEAANRLSDSRRYDIVLVDEAQDFDHSALELAHAMLKPSRRDLGSSGQDFRSYQAGHLVLALDSAQNVYRRSMTWNPPGITARGRTTIFRRNYRNTRQILEFAWNFLSGSTNGSDAARREDDIQGLILPEASDRHGPAPRVFECGSLRSEAEAMASEVEGFFELGVHARDIAVMYGHHQLEEELRRVFDRRRLPYFHIQARNRKGFLINRDRAMTIHDQVRASTIHGLKGLEFSRILIGGVNRAYAHDVPEEEQTAAVSQLIYVGMTRAMDELVITYSGDGEIGRALRAASA